MQHGIVCRVNNRVAKYHHINRSWYYIDIVKNVCSVKMSLYKSWLFPGFQSWYFTNAFNQYAKYSINMIYFTEIFYNANWLAVKM